MTSATRSDDQERKHARLRVGISGSYGGVNLGDEAILTGMIGELRSSLSAELTVFSRDPEDTLKRHRVERSVAIRQLTRQEAREEVKRLDVLILGGGGILYDADAETYLREVMLAQELGVLVAVYAISAGPLQDPKVRTTIANVLNKIPLITVRDKQGYRLLEDVGVENDIHLTADPALLIEATALPAEALMTEGVDFDRHLVGFSVREPGPAAPHISPTHYYELLANAADFMIDRLNADVVFVPMEKGDIRHSHGVVANMEYSQRAEILRRNYTSQQILSLIGRFDFCVGMRLHFLIFSALQSVPFVALPYASKVTGFIQDLEMAMPPMHDVRSGRLIASIDRAWDTRHEIKTKIQRLLPGLKERARETNGLLLKMLHEETQNGVGKERRQRNGSPAH
ncbi:MAG: Polysaccharide pyruvyl transferase CsaB [Nitrospira sp.]|jgi:polysaccharide pyruvyl transferase CsaB|nr:MAG: Polysaccharide pyruvyl transferase CsaB [Nitrospira sp.]